MKIVTIIGTRPQFIKAATVSRVIRDTKNIEEIIVHTGQHFDINMSDIFFNEMEIPKPNYNLNINGLGHGAMTGQMLEKIEEVLKSETPDYVLVYGDTNSTLAGALAAKKMHIKLAHVEAGLRSFNMKMPEEINRILSDRISDILFCPTEQAIKNLTEEGFKNFNIEIINSGDVMLDAALFYNQKAKPPSFKLPSQFILTTIHRAENTDNIEKLKSIVFALNNLSEDCNIVLPLHPRTQKIISENNLSFNKNRILLTAPVGYFEILYLLQNCKLVMTDSGGMQKEAYFFKKPCITLRDETEWVELVNLGANIIAGSNHENILNSYKMILKQNINFEAKIYGCGNAAEQIVDSLIK